LRLLFAISGADQKTDLGKTFSVIPGFQGAIANGWHLAALQQWREL
jgi:hypothetical protein